MEERKERALTITEAIEMTISRLEEIRVPVRYGDEIARPICAAVGQLRACLDAMTRQEMETAEPEEEAGADGGERDGV